MIRRVLSLSLALVLSACSAAAPPRVTPPPGGTLETIRLGITKSGNTHVVTVPFEEYVLASVLAETAPATDDVRAARVIFEVQAIAARTYAISHRGRHAADNFDVCDTTHCQLADLERARRSRWAALARASVEDTRGEVLWYAGRPATVLFHADCGGFRASAEDVWGGPAPAYLGGGADPLPAGHEHLAWKFVVSKDKLRDALNAQPRTEVGARLDTIDVQRRDASGRAALLLLNGERAPLVRGEELRSVVSRQLGARTLRSSRFEVRREGERFVFEGRGFGHGVGLCQRGAGARAAAGASAAEILAFYFPGTVIRSGRFFSFFRPRDQGRWQKLKNRPDL